MPLLHRIARRLPSSLLAPFTDQRPAARLIRQSAKKNWKLLALNFFTSLAASLSEGATLGIIFLSVSLISAPENSDWSKISVLGSLNQLPWLQDWLSATLSTRTGRDGIFILLLIAAVALQGLMAATTYVNSVCTAVMGARMGTEITGNLNDRVLSLSFGCASRYRVGDLLNYVGSGGSTVQKEISLANGLLMNSLQLLIYVLILVAISPWLLLVAIGMAAVMQTVQKFLLPRIRRNSREQQSVGVELSSHQNEQIQGLRLLHSTGQLESSRARLKSLLSESKRLSIRQSKLSNMVQPISNMLPIISIALIAALSLLVFKDRSSGVLPSLVTFIIALQRLNQRVGSLTGLATGYAANSANVERLNEILRDDDKDFVRSGGIPFTALKSGIQLDDVSLQYSPNLPPALSSIQLRIGRGQTVALVGSSGAGKSSIADLLAGLYEPTGGRILIDGEDLRDIKLSSWQQRLGVVSQDTFLFNASIASNIGFGVNRASLDDIKDAAAKAQAAGFIADLPEGYETKIGERGYRLSGGQRQRISLARAILRKPELLILDEATSALDSQSERLVQQAIEQFERQHTVLVIAHRLSTIVNADVICVMSEGRILERGRHHELLAQSGLYAKLWSDQSKHPQQSFKAATPV
ncbi:ABC transporter ATP-binding protein [Cyanobium sp. N5-Cardenillas]|uniref:ABC transporter ATP-binding protein n=1 Tax=Cyanobium sp. N5-Cardenillas TaxID=2823720 RepID=UPI0020CBBFC2|nr:ABC transporter ATP-binding protein [Cyanobium sp. N5-Cardenillas]MCP9786105.1 ABC transporter ATP-binding protein [Cyanobium sp. N5-Cardenillas]